MKTKKALTFQSRLHYLFISTILKRWFQLFGLHPQLDESLRLQFPFVFRRLQSLQLLLPVLPCRRFLRCFFPLPSGLFPCLPSDSGTRPAAIPFTGRQLASQQLPQRLSLPLSVPGRSP